MLAATRRVGLLSQRVSLLTRVCGTRFMSADTHLYTSTHEWVSADGTVGISVHAAELLGELVYVELPEVGDQFAQGDVFTFQLTVFSIERLLRFGQRLV